MSLTSSMKSYIAVLDKHLTQKLHEIQVTNSLCTCIRDDGLVFVSHAVDNVHISKRLCLSVYEPRINFHCLDLVNFPKDIIVVSEMCANHQTLFDNLCKLSIIFSLLTITSIKSIKSFLNQRIFFFIVLR